MIPENLLKKREGEEGDKNFIYATFLRSSYFSNKYRKRMDKEQFYQTYIVILEQILSNPKTEIKVICLIEDPVVIIGYAIMKEESLVYFAYVKPAWRKLGLFKELIGTKVDSIAIIDQRSFEFLDKHTELKINLKPLE